MAKPIITKRLVKGAALDYQELDDNFQNIIDSILTVTDGVDDINLELIDTLEITGDHNIKITATPSGNIITIDNELPVITKSPHGFETLVDTTLSFDSGTRTFTINLDPAYSDYAVFLAGEEYLKTASESVVIPNVTGLYLIYYNSSGVLSQKTGYLTFGSEAAVAHVYWNASTSTYKLADQRHGVTMDWKTHEYLHRTRGASFASGFAASNYTLSGDGSSNSHAQIDLSSGTFYDEDLKITITHSNTPAANTYQQDLQGPAQIPVAYHSGSTGEWVFDTATDYPIKVGTIAKYNLNTAGTWTTPDITSTHYVAMWIVATNFYDTPIIAIMGQRSDNKLEDSENNNTWDGLDLTNFPSEEFLPLYRLIFRSSTAYTNTPKSYLAEITDLRQAVSGAGTGVSLAPNSWGTIAVSGQNSVIADSVNDTLTLVAGTGITLTTSDTADSITITSSSGIANIVEDLTPQLGGDLDVNGQKIVSVSNNNVVIEPNGTGDVYLNADTVRIGDENVNSTIQKWGTGSLTIQGGTVGGNRPNIVLGSLEPSSGTNQNINIISDYNIFLSRTGGSTIQVDPSTGSIGKSGSTFSVYGGEGSGSSIAFYEGTSELVTSNLGVNFNAGSGVVATLKGGARLSTADIRLFAGGTNGGEVRVNTDGNVRITPRSTGVITVGSGTANATVTSNGAYDLILNTNNGTNSGSITIADGADQDITIAPNGTGGVVIDGEIDINATTTNTPTNTTTVVAWLEIGANGNVYYLPLYQ